MSLKQVLKFLKLHESAISSILGVLVILSISALLFYQYQKTQTPTGVTSESAAQTSLQEENKLVHTVTEGDSFWSIAEEYYSDGFSWHKIADANSSITPESLEVGQEIIIPDQKSEIEPEIASENTRENNDDIETYVVNNIEQKTYSVENGENLWEIAVKIYNDGYMWPQIAQANNLQNPNLIHPGNVLKLPS